MIINTGMRTDIPAFYSEWFMNRIRAGFVLVRNPYHPDQITRYELNPDVVDCLAFCTKNPAPMLKHLDELKAYHQYWFVTITPYGRDVEPNVPPKEKVMQDFIMLSETIGISSVGWRYDPIFIDSTYTLDRHISDFEQMCRTLSGYTHVCVISFIDLYEKASSGKVNFAGKLKEYDEINRDLAIARDGLDNARNLREYDYYDDIVNELKDKLDLLFSDDSEYTMYRLLDKKLKKEPDIRYGELNKWLANNFSSMIGDWMVSNLYRDAGIDGFKCDNEYCLFNFKKINANIIKDRDKLVANYS